MATLAYVVTGAAVRVTVPTKQKGIWEARILKRGGLVPGNVRKAELEWLVSQGFVAPVKAETEAVTAKEATVTLSVADSAEDVFDPKDHSVEEVTAYLDEADEDERARVLSAEAEGKNRKGIRDWVPAEVETVED